MADPTPPSDIPDPASPTPVSPSPLSGAAAGSKRIRSMPDRPASARPTGSIRSMPEATRGAASSSNAYTATLSGDNSWSLGLAILWGLFLVVMCVDIYNAACYCLAGKFGWPLPVDVVRVGLFCTAFIALWSGLGVTRYFLALVSFAAGIWLWIDCTLSYRAYPQLMATGSANWTVYSHAESIPKVLVGLFCLVLAAYVFFSYDVREFLAHRRRRGRIWSALLSAIVVYGLMLAVFAVPLFYGKWMQDQYADAQRFGDETLRTMAEHWAPTSLDAKLDSGYAKTGLTKADRVTTFANFKALGALKTISPLPVVPRAPMPQYPLQDKYPIPQGITSQADAGLKEFEVTAKYATESVDFEHGHAKFGFDLVRALFGPWRIAKLNVENVQYDQPPKPAPTPVPEGTPVPAGSATPLSSPAATPATLATPTATTSTRTTDAAAPTPVPATPTTVAPSIAPAASPTP